MPTYEYKCENCNHEFDVYQSMTDEKLTKCPNCGQNTLKRLIGTGSGLIFKGSGFYLTDYKNKPAENLVAKTDKTAENKEATKKQTEATNSSETKTVESSTKKPEKKIDNIKSDN